MDILYIKKGILPQKLVSTVKKNSLDAVCFVGLYNPGNFSEVAEARREFDLLTPIWSCSLYFKAGLYPMSGEISACFISLTLSWLSWQVLTQGKYNY